MSCKQRKKSQFSADLQIAHFHISIYSPVKFDDGRVAGFVLPVRHSF